MHKIKLPSFQNHESFGNILKMKEILLGTPPSEQILPINRPYSYKIDSAVYFTNKD